MGRVERKKRKRQYCPPISSLYLSVVSSYVRVAAGRCCRTSASFSGENATKPTWPVWHATKGGDSA